MDGGDEILLRRPYLARVLGTGILTAGGAAAPVVTVVGVVTMVANDTADTPVLLGLATVAAGLPLWVLLWRSWTIGARLTPEGVEVRNFYRCRRIRWGDVEEVSLGGVDRDHRSSVWITVAKGRRLEITAVHLLPRQSRVVWTRRLIAQARARDIEVSATGPAVSRMWRGVWPDQEQSL